MTDETKPMPDEIYIEYPDGCIWWHKNVGSMTKYTRADLTQPQGETIEALLAMVPSEYHWSLDRFADGCVDFKIISRDGLVISDAFDDALYYPKDIAEAIKSALSKAGG